MKSGIGVRHTRSAGCFLVFFWAVLFPAVGSAQSKPSAYSLRQVTGQTRKLKVPMAVVTAEEMRNASQGWSQGSLSTAERPAVAPTHNPPGYQLFKDEANERRRQALARSKRIETKPVSAPPSVSNLGAIFTGLTFDDTTCGCVPPDPSLAVGNSYVMEAANTVVRIYDKSGSVLFTDELSDFFSSLGAGVAYDPQVIYDVNDARFILTVGGIVNGNQDHVLIAISADSNPLDGFYEWSIDTSDGLSGNLSDFPRLGLSQSAVYITTDQFAPDGFYADIRVVDLIDLLIASDTLSVTVFKGVKSATGYPAWVIQPAVTYGNTQNEFLVASAYPYFAAATDQLNLFSINTSGNPVLTALDLTVAGWNEPPAADQPGSLASVDTDASFLGNAVWQNNVLATAHTVATADGTAAVAQYYLLNLPDSSGLSSASLNDTGTVGFGDSYYPATTLNASGEMGMVYDESSSEEYISSYATGKFLTEAAGVTSPASTFAVGGATTSYAYRWGDYSGITVDPVDDTFWGLGEPAGGSQVWTTEIANFHLLGTTSVSLTSTPNPSAAGQGVTFTITVAVVSGKGTPTGQVALLDANGNAVALADLSGNTGIINGYVLPNVGTFAFFAEYFGDANFERSVVPLCCWVSQVVEYASTTKLTSTPNPSNSGQTVTFTAQVSSAGGLPAGTVTFKNGTTVLSQVAVVHGFATYSTAALSAGSHTISATYNGSSTFLSSSAALVQTVNKWPTAITISSSSNPSSYGQPVTFAVAVSSTVGFPTGTVVFTKGTMRLGSVILASGGTAKFTTTPTQLTVGSDTITATYNGDASHSPSSVSMTQTVTKTATTTTLTATPDPSTFGQTVTFTGTVTAAYGAPGGNLTFKDGTKFLASVPLSSGVASFSTATLAKGSHTITATYNGNNNFSGSTASLVQTVN